eukprot:GHVU01029021.1.p1 GENE.GHVU01029021.1~~GHVU01029021.1.p1  ORF type:complete len:238 (-),score=5.41 GHVU01029021.1:274-987(-)
MTFRCEASRSATRPLSHSLSDSPGSQFREQVGGALRPLRPLRDGLQTYTVHVMGWAPLCTVNPPNMGVVCEATSPSATRGHRLELSTFIKPLRRTNQPIAGLTFPSTRPLWHRRRRRHQHQRLHYYGCPGSHAACCVAHGPHGSECVCACVVCMCACTVPPFVLLHQAHGEGFRVAAESDLVHLDAKATGCIPLRLTEQQSEGGGATGSSKAGRLVVSTAKNSVVPRCEWEFYLQSR